MIQARKGLDRLPDPGAGFVWDRLDAVPFLKPFAEGVNASFTTRVGGTSARPFDELNLSFKVGDAEEHVRSNRGLAGQTIDRDGRWSVVKQVHGGDTVRAMSPGQLPEADALWTDDPGDTLAVLAADCIPGLVVAQGAAAAVHAGWRGLIAGVVESAVRAVSGSAFYAGPAIGPCCFEVGPEVVEAFADRFGSEAVADDSHVDLWAAAELAARSGGAGEVASARLCTSCHPELFFSHRRDAGRSGRQALIARLSAGDRRDG